MRSICQIKILKPCYWLCYVLLSFVCSVFISFQTYADGQWTSHMSGVYTSFSSTMKIQGTDNYSDYNYYLGCLSTGASLFGANNFYGDGTSFLYNIHFSSRGTNNISCLYGAGGSIGDSNFEYNRITFEFHLTGAANGWNRINFPSGYIYGSSGGVYRVYCGIEPSSQDMSGRDVTCVGTLSNYEKLADYDIWLNGDVMGSGYPIYTMCNPVSSDKCSNIRPMISSNKPISWVSSNEKTWDDSSISQDLKEQYDYQNQFENDSIIDANENVDKSVTDIMEDIILSNSSLLQVFTDFISTIINAQPSDCSVPVSLFDTSAYGFGDAAQTYTIDLCALPVPNSIAVIGSVVVMGICALLSWVAVRLLINMLRRLGE